MNIRHSKNILITGGNFVNVDRPRSAFEKLQQHTATGAFHNSGERYDPPKCHPNTRVVVLQRIMDWITGSSDPDAYIMWLYGGAGAGKSAIAQTIAENCHKKGLLLASFFFSRSDPTRNYAGCLFPTLAYQIACTLPKVQKGQKQAINKDPLIFTRSLEMQIIDLIVNPLQSLITHSFWINLKRAPCLIIIDGLDECNTTEAQLLILNAISKSLSSYRMPLRFLIASRPEPAITHKFNSPMFSHIHIRLALNDQILRTDVDIRRFLKDSFADVRANHPFNHHIPITWPSTQAIDKMVEKSSGHFIYAALAMKHIQSINDHPTRSLDTVLGLKPPRHDMPFAELDALFLYILTSVKYQKEALDIIASSMFTGHFPLGPIEFLLHMDKGDAEVFLAELQGHGLVYIDGTVNISHASFQDFLVDSSRSGPFYLNQGELCTKFSIHLLQSFKSHQLHGFAKLEKNYSSVNIMAAARSNALKHFLDWALPTHELRAAIKDCSLEDMFNDLVLDAWDYAGLLCVALTFDLPRYLDAVHKMELEDLDQIYDGLLSSFDKLWICELDHLSNKMTDYTFFGSALMLSNLSSNKVQTTMNFLESPACKSKHNLEPFSQIAFHQPRLRYPDTMPFIQKFLKDANRSQHHAMNGQKYASAAALCLKLLSDKSIFLELPILTGHDKKTQKKFPWKWRQLARIIQQRHKMLACLQKISNDKLSYPYPHFRQKWMANYCRKSDYLSSKDDVYYCLLEVLPDFLSKSDRSIELMLLCHKSFTLTSNNFSDKTKEARLATERYIARVSEHGP